MQAHQLNEHLTEGAVSAAHTVVPLDVDDIHEWNRLFDHLTAQARVELALRFFPGAHVLSSSFGAQSAVALHLLTQAAPDIPVVLLDTGYLFDETYAFVDQLTNRLNLNLHVYRNPMPPAEQEVRYGQRWTQGEAGLDAYNYDNKVEPMRRALAELQAGTWFTGLRRSQSDTREATPYVQEKEGRIKVAPIADWSDKDVHNYLKKHQLPYHPLWHKGYISIGDTHTTRAVHEVDHPDQVRFFGIKRECGLHT